MSVIIWLEHCFGHQWGFICLTVFWLNCDLKTSVKEYSLWYLWSSHFFLSTKAAYEFQCWLLSMKCQWIFIFITQHSVLMQCICFYTFIHAACFLTIKLCNSESILVKDYVFSCNFWDLNLLFFMVMTMYPSITYTPEWHLICLKG